jgi:hypothetical protein
MQRIKGSRNGKKRFDSNPTGKTVPITVFEEHIVKMNKVIAFNF